MEQRPFFSWPDWLADDANERSGMPPDDRMILRVPTIDRTGARVKSLRGVVGRFVILFFNVTGGMGWF